MAIFIRPAWLDGWVFVGKLSGCCFDSNLVAFVEIQVLGKFGPTNQNCQLKLKLGT